MQLEWGETHMLALRYLLEADNYGGQDEWRQKAGLTFIQNMDPNLFQVDHLKVELFWFSMLLHLDEQRHSSVKETSKEV